MKYLVKYYTGQGPTAPVIVEKETLADACRFSCALPSNFRVQIEESPDPMLVIEGDELDRLLAAWDEHSDVLAKVLR